MEFTESDNPKKVQPSKQPLFGPSSRIVWSEVGKHALFAIVVGIVTGFASMLLCICADGSFQVFKAATWLVWLLPVAGVLEMLLYRLLKLPEDLKTPHVVEKIRENEPISPTLAPGILAATCMSILCGASVGKEAGALQMGASLGSFISRPFKLRPIVRRDSGVSMAGYAGACGMSACFAALFFAPLGSAMFMLELSRFDKSLLKHSPAILLACFIGSFISSNFGIGDNLSKVPIPQFEPYVLGVVLVVGVLAAIAGRLFKDAIECVHALTDKSSKWLYACVAIGGLAFAAVVWLFGLEQFAGSGGTLLNRALHGDFETWAFAIKLLLTWMCLAFWIKGGEIMPSFCIGGLLGAACASMLGVEADFGAAIGVMCFFCAFSRCPLAAFLMGCEIFGCMCAPYLAISILVAFLCGSSVGYYGKDADATTKSWFRKIAGIAKRKDGKGSE